MDLETSPKLEETAKSMELIIMRAFAYGMLLITCKSIRLDDVRKYFRLG